MEPEDPRGDALQLYSLQFALFLAASLAAYYAVGRLLGKGQWVVLLAASLGFYLASGWQNMAFILLTSATTWASGVACGRIDARCAEARKAARDRAGKKALKEAAKRRKWAVLLACMLLNFGVLGYLKYWEVILAGLGDPGFMASGLLLPLGISFYTFQSVGYAIDCYNSKYAPESNYARFLLFVSFFPQLIQGPINRYDDMAAQLFERRSFDLARSRRALVLVGFGAMKKFMIADVLVSAISVCLDGSITTVQGLNPHIGLNPSTPGSVVAFGILLYTVQQYGDFSGGIDMVRGVAELFGVRMAENFRQPYFSTSLSDFWRRWHMTLGAWMRDYVFYPLAVRPSLLRLNKWGTEHLGKHVGRTLSACIGNVVVFLLVGLWHGAEAHYVLWGLYNGLVIASADMLRPAFAALTRALRLDVGSAGYRVFAIARTFLLVNVGRYFDRLYDFGDCLQGLYNTVFSFRAGDFMEWLSVYPIWELRISLTLAVIGCVIVFIVSFNKERGVDVMSRFLKLNAVLRCLIYVVVGSLVLFSFAFSGSSGGFLYANF